MSIHFRSGQIFVVANYDPPGNFIGSFAENVVPLLTSSQPYNDSQTETVNTDKDNMNSELFVKAILKYHNDYRKKHKVPALR